MKKSLLKEFLEKKNIQFKDCTKRQQEILTKEKPPLWDWYTWNI